MDAVAFREPLFVLVNVIVEADEARPDFAVALLLQAFEFLRRERQRLYL